MTLIRPGHPGQARPEERAPALADARPMLTIGLLGGMS